MPNKKVVIWMHGLGASHQDMQYLAESLSISSDVLQHICLQAPNRPVTINQGYVMPAWYDIVSLQRGSDEDKAGMVASERIILDQIDKCLSKGYAHQDIYLAGLSQGGVMALFTALRLPYALAGVVALSCYLPLADEWSSVKTQAQQQCPIFMAHGQFDEVIPLPFAELSKERLVTLGFSNLQWHVHAMGHEVCMPEITQLKHWFESH